MKMNRNTIRIDPDLCDGCGKCITACSEAALAIENRKAFLISEDFCDGMGRCMPFCPTGALSLGPRPCSDLTESAYF